MSETLVRMPRLADTLVEGTVGRWLKQVGDRVGQGEALASIETDKVTTDLGSPAAGTLLEVLVPEGGTVAVETPIARIGDSDAVAATPSAEPAAPRKVTPVAARLLAEHGLTADEVPSAATRLTRDDVLRYVMARAPAPQTPVAPRRTAARDGELVPLTSMRRAIAEHMTKARQTIPHGQTVMAVDLTDLVRWRDAARARFQQQEGANLTYTVCFVYALAHALAAHTSEADIDLGVAVAVDNGLIVPVLRAANTLTLGQTARGITEIATRARDKRISAEDLQGGRMTVTNVGSFGNLTASPIVPLGQIGILGPGLVERRPLPDRAGGIRPGWQCLLSLVFDRREFDDLAADRLLRRVTEQLLALAR